MSWGSVFGLGGAGCVGAAASGTSGGIRSREASFLRGEVRGFKSDVLQSWFPDISVAHPLAEAEPIAPGRRDFGFEAVGHHQWP